MDQPIRVTPEPLDATELTAGARALRRGLAVLRLLTRVGPGGLRMAEIVRRIRAELDAASLPPGVTASLEGTFQAQEEASRRIGILSIVSLALVFAILYSRYRSAVLAAIIMGGVPLALIGSVAALALAGQPLSVASMVGFITLAGIATRNGILKISHYINLALREQMEFGTALVIRGSLERMTPVLMTALAMVIGMVPMALGVGEGAEQNAPLGRAVIGGLLFGTAILFAHSVFDQVATAKLPDPHGILVGITTVMGALLGAWGGALRRRHIQREAVKSGEAAGFSRSG